MDPIERPKTIGHALGASDSSSEKLTSFAAGLQHLSPAKSSPRELRDRDRPGEPIGSTPPVAPVFPIKSVDSRSVAAELPVVDPSWQCVSSYLERTSSLIDALDSSALGPGTRAVVRQLVAEATKIQKVLDRIRSVTGAWAPSRDDLDFHLPAVFLPDRSVPLYVAETDGTTGQRLFQILLSLERLRRLMALHLTKYHGIELTEAIPGHTRFDSHRHEDFPAHRMGVGDDSAHLDGVIYGLIRPGFTQGGNILSRAIVKRYVSSKPASVA